MENTESVRNASKQTLEAFKDALDKDRIDTKDGTIDEYSVSMLPVSNRVLGVLFPKYLIEVEKIVAVANSRKIPLHPISQGKNWGYGAANPWGNGQVVVDLKKMNKVLSVNEQTGYAVVEPGVTQRQLYAYLKEHKHEWILDVTGASPDASIVGNALERGFGFIGEGDHSSNVCSLEVVLGSGTVIKTGPDKDSKTSFVYPHAPGVSVRELFFQSNFGIVTKMVIWLLPAPGDVYGAFFSFNGDKTLFKLVDDIQSLKKRGIVRSKVKIANDFRVLSTYFDSHPQWHIDGSLGTAEDLEALKKDVFIKDWSGGISLHGTDRQISEAWEELEIVFKKNDCEYIFLYDKLLKQYDRNLKLLQKFNKITGFKIGKKYKMLYERAIPAFNLMKGIPSIKFMNTARWQSKASSGQFSGTENAYNEVKNSCGLIWFSPVVPFASEHIMAATGLMRNVYKKYGFRFFITINLMDVRSAILVSNISYDIEKPKEIQKAIECFGELCSVMESNGYMPYRLANMPLPERYDTFPKQTLKSDLKKVFDPNNIISPGKYGIGV